MQSSGTLINLMTFNMASTHNLENSITGTNHSSLEQNLYNFPSDKFKYSSLWSMYLNSKNRITYS
jgi:hypothetical protein